jgi:phenylpropionate dioxygenase-like ring-hydroxylating dioxygenase large terminal subunit
MQPAGNVGAVQWGMTASTSPTAGWFPVARSAEVGTTPVPVGAAGHAWVVVRLRPEGQVSAFPARCPHRLVPLAAGSVVDGTLQCSYHGWRFGADGRCAEVPSLGPEGTPPPRADLPVPWAIAERDGWVWLAPEPAAQDSPPAPVANPEPEPAVVPPAPSGRVFGNLDPSLEHAWHPVARSGELSPGGWLQVRLLGRNWTLHRGPGGLEAAPAAYGVRERLGLIWLAPAEPVDVPLEFPEDGDRAFVAGWLPAERSIGPAGPLADNFLDVAHFPFVHAATFGAADEKVVPAYDVVHEAGGFTSVQEQWCDNPQDPAVAAGTRPLRQRRRATYVFRAPFQLRLRLEFLESGAVTTILFMLQPEDVDSTRIYTCLLLHAGPGQPLPSPEWVAQEVEFERRVLGEDLDLQAEMLSGGLPLVMRDELHVRADRLGVALRRSLIDFAAAAEALSSPR